MLVAGLRRVAPPDGVAGESAASTSVAVASAVSVDDAPTDVDTNAAAAAAEAGAVAMCNFATMPTEAVPQTFQGKHHIRSARMDIE